jgi:hypothetical protein
MAAGGKLTTRAAKARSTVASTVNDKAAAAGASVRRQETRGPSPNPATNLVIADIALRGGGRLLRHLIERSLLSVKYPSDKASKIIQGRTMTQTLIGTAAARIATRSVPGALVVGGWLVAKALYDRSKSRAEAQAEGEREIQKQADNADKA